ncbi:hypothetical protein PENSPDRAFT_691182 [Peniophora sp. CONT]|nr:hypothetical protein PENSPDRAFT_691182 [Peniophora sp. CONT]
MNTSDRAAMNAVKTRVEAIRNIMRTKQEGRVHCPEDRDVLFSHLKDVQDTMLARYDPTTDEWWAALVRSSGLVTLLVEMLLDLTFFDESSKYIGLVLYPLSFLVVRERLGSALGSVLDATVPVWEHIWSHRRHLNNLASTKQGKQTLSCWAQLVCAWAELYSEECDIPQQCHLTHVGLHVWIIHKDCPTELPLLHAIRVFEGYHLPEAVNSAQAFYVQCIEAPYGAGADALASRLSCALKEGVALPHKVEHDTIPLFGWLLFCVGEIYLCRSELHGRPLYDRFFSEMLDAIVGLSRDGVELTEVLTLFHKLVVCYAQFYLDHIPNLESPSMQDRTFVRWSYAWLNGRVLGMFLAQGLYILCHSLIFRVDEVDPELFAMELVLTWADWKIVLRRVQKSCATNTFAADLMFGIKDALHADCVPYLARAQRFAKNNAVERALGRFTELARVMDLDVGQDEISEFNATHCSWRGCPFYSDGVPPASLMACKGCGVTRYCGDDCQRHDWVDGKHKRQCQRLKV